ncbi:MAG: hypothetical protein AB7E51_00350 [Pseudodesulfovibrio sp.]|uniref:hypothetical protein n=1 Tax=Pseudodesulfovibrio sp. TaxID=2035812 RepID=UPI003D0D03D0
MTIPCSSCQHHRSKSNPTQGKLIPNHHGKCTRPEGLCDEILAHERAVREESRAFLDDEPVLIPELTEEHAQRDLEVQNTASAIDQAVMDAEEVFRDLGRLEGVSFMATVADVAAAQIFEKIKKNKAYKNIPYIDADGNRRRVADLEEFCQVKLGKSSRRVRELVQNLHILGPDLYESAERIGFRSKDYRALKALPEAEQAIVKQAIESESKEEVLTILEDMAAKHQAEREAAKKEREDLSADLEARGKLLEDKSKRLGETEEELYRLKSLPKDADLELRLAREEEAVERLHREHVTILAGIKPFFQVVSEILGDGDVSAHTKEHAVSETRQVCEAINQFLLDCSIPVDFSEIVYPDWMRGNAQADLESGNTEEPNGAHGSW